MLGKYNSRSDTGFLSGITDPALNVQLGDVADPWFVQTLTEGVDTVFHLAALIGIPYSYRAPTHYVQANIQGTIAVLEAARAHSVRRVVHTSTSETYGTAQYRPIDESHPLVAQSPYSATKIAADKLAESYYASFDVPVTILRPFNTYGPRQSLRALIPSLMAQAIHSDEIVTGSLDPIRDMNYVADTVDGFMAVGEAAEVEGEVFNIGSGVGHSVSEILNLVLEVAEASRPVRQVQERTRPARSEVGELICDFSKAASVFGYKPQTTLRKGLERVREYIERQEPPPEPAVYRV